MVPNTNATRRIVIAVLLVVVLPFAVGVLSGLSYFVTGEPMMPSWVHSERVLLSWLTVIVASAWFVAGNDKQLLKRLTIVVIASWFLSECLGAGVIAVIFRFTKTDVQISTFRLVDAGVMLLRALAGLAAGLGIRIVFMRSVTGMEN